MLYADDLTLNMFLRLIFSVIFLIVVGTLNLYMNYGDYNKEHSEKHKEITQIPKKNSILYFTYASVFVCVTIKKCGTNSY